MRTPREVGNPNRSSSRKKMSSSFRVDVLLKALEELQKEKSQNEKILAEERLKVKKLESTEANSMFALIQTKEKYQKSKEAARMEEQRVEQTQDQIQQYEQVNDRIREKIATLSKQIEDTKDRKRSNINNFEQRMNELSECFRMGWASLDGSSMEDYQAQKSKLETTAETYQDKVKHLSEQIQLELTADDSDIEAEATASTLDEVRKMFEEENMATKALLGRKEQELGIGNLEKELAALLDGNAEEAYAREI